MELIRQPYFIKIIIMAIILRLLIMPFYFHPDIKEHHFHASFLQKGEVDIYSYLREHKNELPIKQDFSYFPLTYFFLGSYQLIVSPLLGGEFKDWLFDSSSQAVEEIGVFRYLFFLKLPYLFLDLAIAFILTKFFTDFEKKKKVFALWLLNPFSIVLIYVFSNVDILPVFISLISILLLRKNKVNLSALLLGIAAGFKAYTLIFLPFLMLSVQGLKKKALIFALGLISFFFIILPFWSPSFKEAALVSGLTTRMVSFGVSIGFNEIIIIPIMLLSALFFRLSLYTQNPANIWKYYLIAILFIFSFIHFHIQWLLWILPLLVLLLVENPKLKELITILLVTFVLIPLLLEDKSMSVSLLSVVDWKFTQLPTPFVAVQKLYDPYVLQSISHSVFVGASLVLSLSILKEEIK